MELDLYDEDLPEPYMTLAEFLKSNKETILTVGKIIAVPTSAFLLTCVFNYFVSKKIGSL